MNFSNLQMISGNDLNHVLTSIQEKLFAEYFHYFGIFCMIFCIIFWIDCSYIRPRRYFELFKQMKQIKVFEYSHSNNQSEPEQLTPPVRLSHCVNGIYTIWYIAIWLVYESGKTSFSKHFFA